MALTEAQTGAVWTKRYEAEIRSLYFGDLATQYTVRKQRIVALSFFLSSGAAATWIARFPSASWIAAGMSLIVAGLTAYSIAKNLDKAALKMAKLHAAWNQISDDYDRLWNHWFEDGAEAVLEDIQKRVRDVSEEGTTEAPYKPKLMEKWQEHVNAVYFPTETTA
ncbi:MAG: hypothetical protein WD733_15790 [Bryobacterales bacterium]